MPEITDDLMPMRGTKRRLLPKAAAGLLALAAVALGPGAAAAGAETPTQLAYGFEAADNATFSDVRGITIVNDPVNSGERAMQAASNAYRNFRISTQLGQATAYRFYARWEAAPSSGTAQIAWGYAGGVGGSFTVRVDPQGRVSLRDAGGSIKAQSAPLATSSWHLIELIVTQSSGSPGQGSLRVNGTDVATDVPGNFGSGATDSIRIGQISATALPGITQDDVAVGEPGGSWIGPPVAPPPPPPPPPPPTTQISYGFEDGDAAVFQDVRQITRVSDPVNTGSWAMSPAAGAYRSFHTQTVIGQPTAYRMYARWSEPPASGAAQIGWLWSDIGHTATATIRVDASGRISLRDAGGSNRAQSGPVAPNAWHLIELIITQTDAATGTGSLRVDGVDIALNVPGKYGTAVSDRFRIGQIGSTALPGVVEDDIAVSEPGGTWLGPVSG